MAHSLDSYAVMGNPIAHSKSPQIHRLFAAQTGEALTYDALLVAVDDFSAAVERFRQQGGCGLNITVPFKQQAWALAVERTERAQRAGAVNTLVLHGDASLQGDNTDGVGLVNDLCRNHHLNLKDKRLLVLGAGGAVRGVLASLLQQKPKEIVIANRTPERAVELAQHFADLGNLQGCGFASLAGAPFDLIINGTAASLKGQVPPLPEGLVAPSALCYDMMYSAAPTPFQTWSTQQGAAQSLDGLGMLVEQAAESFYLWRGVRPETAAVINALRMEMQ